MRPLKERETVNSALEADAIALLRSVSPYEPPPGQKQRVTARLLSERRVRRPRALRVVFAFAVVLCAAGASAAVGGHWLQREYRALLGSDEKTARAASVPAQRMSANAAPSASAVAAASVSAAPSELPAAAPAPVASSIDATSRDAKRGPSEAARSPSEAATLVFSAMRALRQEGRPDRAAKLLEEYLRNYPRGALAEEALALSVEAAAQRGDARARALADRYLKRYPNGQFRVAAERARALFSP